MNRNLDRTIPHEVHSVMCIRTLCHVTARVSPNKVCTLLTPKGSQNLTGGSFAMQVRSQRFRD